MVRCYFLQPQDELWWYICGAKEKRSKDGSERYISKFKYPRSLLVVSSKVIWLPSLVIFLLCNPSKLVRFTIYFTFMYLLLMHKKFRASTAQVRIQAFPSIKKHAIYWQYATVYAYILYFTL